MFRGFHYAKEILFLFSATVWNYTDKIFHFVIITEDLPPLSDLFAFLLSPLNCNLWRPTFDVDGQRYITKRLTLLKLSSESFSTSVTGQLSPATLRLFPRNSLLQNTSLDNECQSNSDKVVASFSDRHACPTVICQKIIGDPNDPYRVPIRRKFRNGGSDSAQIKHSDRRQVRHAHDTGPLCVTPQ